MKKTAIILTAVLLILTLVGCGGIFDYDLDKYVTVPAYDKLSVSKKTLDENVDSAVKDLVSGYKGENVLTEGTVADGNTVYIYYKGTVIVYDGAYEFEAGKSDFKELNDALVNGEFKDGVFTTTVTLSNDFETPAFVAEALKKQIADKKAAEEKEKETETETEEPTEETETEEPTEETVDSTAEPQAAAPVLFDEEDVTATEPATEEPTEETKETEEEEINTAFFAGKEVTFTLTVDGKNGKVESGEKINCNLKWTHVFEGGTYNAESSAEKSKTEKDKKGYALEIGSGSFIDGFEKGLIGVSVKEGTKETLHLTFPSNYTTNVDLSGMNVDFEVEILSVSDFYERDLDNAEQFKALKDDYEAANGKDSFDYADKAAYVADVRKSEKESLAVDAIVKASKTTGKWDYDDLETYENAVLNNYALYYYQITGQMPDSNTVISTFFGGDTQKVVDMAGKNLKRDWVLYKVARDQGLEEVTDEDYDAYIEKQLKSYNASFAVSEANKDVVWDEDDLLDNVYGDKDAVVKTMVLERAAEYLGAHAVED